MKSTIFALLPLAGLAFADPSCNSQRKTVTKTEVQYESAAPTGPDGGQATPEAATSSSSSCSRRTVTATKVEKVTVTVSASYKDPGTTDLTSTSYTDPGTTDLTSTSYTDPGTTDVTSTSYKTVRTYITIRPSGSPPAAPHGASSLQWGNYPNATNHAPSCVSSTVRSTYHSTILPSSSTPAASSVLSSSSAPAPSLALPSSSVPATPISDLPSFSITGQVNPSSSTSSPEAATATPQVGAGSKRGEATFYGGNTDGGMCSFTGYTIPSGLYGTALSDANWDGANACGQCVSVTGPDGNTKITAMVVDQCPGCGSNHVDLYPDAFAKLADPSKGIIQVSWDFVPCGITTPIVLKNKSGTSKSWFSIQVMNANVGVARLEVSIDGGASWHATKRQPYNFFEQGSGFGTDTVDIKITSISGKEVVVKDVSVTPNALKTAGENF